jgi:3-oxoacyl-[acyl-carrier protein] reductase
MVSARTFGGQRAWVGRFSVHGSQFTVCGALYYRSVNLSPLICQTFSPHRFDAHMEKALSGQTAIVTGVSRNRGIGAAICRSLAEAGANIFFTSWQPYDRSIGSGDEPGFPEKLVQELHKNDVQADWLEIDLSGPLAPQQTIEIVNARFGSSHILVNNACFSIQDDYLTVDSSNLDQSYAINIRAPILLSAAFVREFKGRGARRIVSMTSGQSLGPMPGTLSYASTKGGIEAFTLTFAPEVASFGITVNALDPGPTDTGWMTEEKRSQLSQRFPTGRVNTPEDAASVVRFLVSNEAATITGQLIHARGGFA